MKQLFDHATKLGLLLKNPASACKVNDAEGVEKSSERALSKPEIGLVFKIFRENADSFSRITIWSVLCCFYLL